MVNMWDLDHSAARGFMSIQGLYVFTHDNPLGNAPSHMLFDRVTAALREEVKITGRVARSFDDYEMLVDDEDLPDGVSITRLIG
jgi:CRISPR-associated protein Csd2